MNRDDDAPDVPYGEATADSTAEATPAAADRRLKRALRDSTSAPAGAEVDALTARVLAQWRAQPAGAGSANAGIAHGGVEAAAPAGNAAACSPAVQRRRRLWWAGTAGLAAVVALATAVVVSRPDPALEELMQPDVLSQLAIGEM